MKKRSVVLILALVSLLNCQKQVHTGAADTASATQDPLLFSFAYVGCNRIDWTELTDPSTGQPAPFPPSTANEPQLLQTFKDLTQLKPNPTYLFLCGDIVRNESAGTATLTTQLDAWQTLFAGSVAARAKTVTIPFVGNHEVLVSVEYAPKHYYEVPNPDTYGVWSQWLANNHFFPGGAGNGPGAGGVDKLVGDNRQLTYSFDAVMHGGKKAHFVVVNTDSLSSYTTSDMTCYQPPTSDVTNKGAQVAGTASQAVPGWVALDWLQKDIAAAVADVKTDAIFVLGHKPIFNQGEGPDTPSTGRDTIFNCGDQPLAAKLFASFQAAQTAGKFGGYLCAHQHLWNAGQLKGPTGPSIWQVIAGNGGTDLEQGNQFGYTLVQLYKSGKITATAYGRTVPSTYYYAPTSTAATPGQVIVLR